MPQADSFGTQPALEVVREFLNYDGFYDTKELHWKNVYNVTLIAACGNQRESINQNARLLQKFRYVISFYRINFTIEKKGYSYTFFTL